MLEARKNALALGLFDGVHVGHRAVLGMPVKMAEKGFIPSVFTFSGSSLSYKQGRELRYIYTDHQKMILLRELGINQVFCEDFNKIGSLSGEEFAQDVLAGRLNAGYVCCGRDFRFGKKASCGINELAEFGKRFGFQVEIAEDVVQSGENVSSNRIREMLAEGKISQANILLGGEYRIDGEVVHGRQLGRTISFPTVNLNFAENQLVPRKGVYRSVTEIEGEKYNSITNVGSRPTVDDNIAPLSETHILDFSGDIYGRNITVRLLEFVRDEMKFGSVEELKRQIKADTEMVILKCRRELSAEDSL